MVAVIVCLGKRGRVQCVPLEGLRSFCALVRLGVTARARDERGRGRDQGGGGRSLCALGRGLRSPCALGGAVFDS